MHNASRRDDMQGAAAVTRTMQQTLEDHHREILRGIAEIRQHCQRAVPDMAG